jgi:hypothetical protein
MSYRYLNPTLEAAPTAKDGGAAEAAPCSKANANKKYRCR